MPPLLSVIVPVYNEEKTIEEILTLIDSIKTDKEIIAINDGSTDRSKDILSCLSADRGKLNLSNKLNLLSLAMKRLSDNSIFMKNRYAIIL